MTPTITPTTNLDYLDAPIESEKWRNLHFAKDGHFVISVDVYERQEDARNYAERTMKDWKEGKGIYDAFGPKDREKIVLFKDYSHTIQIPVKS